MCVLLKHKRQALKREHSYTQKVTTPISKLKKKRLNPENIDNEKTQALVFPHHLLKKNTMLNVGIILVMHILKSLHGNSLILSKYQRMEEKTGNFSFTGSENRTILQKC